MVGFKVQSTVIAAIFMLRLELCKSKNGSNPFIWQGTHWCGIRKKDIQSHSVLNISVTDKCCKDHDSCPHYISRWSTKYNLFNWRLYTISECSCDEKFKRCLEQDDSVMSKDIKRIYFDMLQVPCFKLKMKPEKACVAWHWYLKCKTYREWMEPYAAIKG